MIDLENKMLQINPTANIFHTIHAGVNLNQILNIGGFDIENVLDIDSFSSHHQGMGKEISSVSLNFPGFVDPEKLKLWLHMLFLTEGMDVFRSKGILNVEHSNKCYLFQSVYMMFEGRFDKLWADNTPENKLVFIGQNLDASRPVSYTHLTLPTIYSV